MFYIEFSNFLNIIKASEYFCISMESLSNDCNTTINLKLIDKKDCMMDSRYKKNKSGKYILNEKTNQRTHFSNNDSFYYENHEHQNFFYKSETLTTPNPVISYSEKPFDEAKENPIKTHYKFNENVFYENIISYYNEFIVILEDLKNNSMLSFEAKRRRRFQLINLLDNIEKIYTEKNNSQYKKLVNDTKVKTDSEIVEFLHNYSMFFKISYYRIVLSEICDKEVNNFKCKSYSELMKYIKTPNELNEFKLKYLKKIDEIENLYQRINVLFKLQNKLHS
ncbi:hypothetical protein A0H76_2020 [Hepatospora eriocheir]|uniref:Uncharacterized protein n=1 Tax=Hepatospora eriocheir TaxID=1081669 RepID=A0A1X0QFZ0_9MICR|nr:hypothetical protein A0H76_2020 [Hepatospora eriocheir]